MQTGDVLVVSDLTKSYRRKRVLSEISFRVGAGEAVAILGSNGAGKSTLLGCITGDRTPDGGSISVCDADPFSDPGKVAACMGFVPEHPFLYGELTVGEMLRFVAEARGLQADQAGDERQRLLDLFSLAGAEDVLCRELSQGMARKAAIICGLLHRPRLMVLDEVFNGLDLASADHLLGELDRRREDGAAVLLSSHDLPMLARWCDRGLLLAPDGLLDLQDEQWVSWGRDPALPASPGVGSGD